MKAAKKATRVLQPEPSEEPEREDSSSLPTKESDATPTKEHEDIADDDDDDDGNAEVDELFRNEKQLHLVVKEFILNPKDADSFLTDADRRKLLSAFPTIDEFPTQAPHADAAFAAKAKPITLKKDKALALLYSAQLQSVRPLLYLWNDLLLVPEPDVQQIRIMDHIQAAVALALHAAYNTSKLRRQWILADVNPTLARQLNSESSAPLFGSSYVDRLERLDTTTRTLSKLSVRDEANSSYRINNYRDSYGDGYRDNSSRSSNRDRSYRDNNDRNDTFRDNRDRNLFRKSQDHPDAQGRKETPSRHPK